MSRKLLLDFDAVSVSTLNLFNIIKRGIGIKNDGQLWSWGYNLDGQKGINSIVNKSTPIAILGTIKTFCSIDSGIRHSIGLNNNGKVWCWGDNEFGQLGINSTGSTSTPVAILGITKTFCKIDNGGSIHSLGIDNHGKVWGWGANTYGELGINSTALKSTPVAIAGTLKTFCSITVGWEHSLGIDNRGKVWGWGWNYTGQLGVNSITSKLIPTAILGSLKTFCSISGGDSFSLGLDHYGYIWSWGFNGNGQLGTNNTTFYSTPVAIAGTLKTFCSISCGNSHSLGLDNHGNVWSWGYNLYGKLGINSTINKSTPVAILGTLKTFCSISGGFHYSSGLDNHGNVWSWGINGSGDLGNNTIVCEKTPVALYSTYTNTGTSNYKLLIVDVEKILLDDIEL